MKLSALLLVVAFSLTSSACLVTSGHSQRRGGVARQECAPSQHWDGQQCRHNGQGRGARKHDGR